MDKRIFLDRLLALPVLLGPISSPDGRHIAFTWRGFGVGAQTYVAATEPGAKARALTAPPGDSHPISWSADGLFLIVGRSHDGDERTSLHRVEVSTGATVTLTERPDDHFLFGGVLHPNGRWLFYAATKDFTTGAAIESAWIWRHDLISGERHAIAKPIGSNLSTPALSPDGSMLLYARNDHAPGGRQLWLVDVEGRDDREVANEGDTVSLSGAWSPDGASIAVRADGPRHSRVGLLSVADGTLRWIIDDAARNVESIAWPKGSRRIVCIETQDAISRGFLLDPGTGDEVPLQNDAAAGTLLPIAPAAHGGWLGHHFEARHPDRLVLFDPESPAQQLDPVAPLPDGSDVDPAMLAAPESVRWRSTDGASVQGWLYRPEKRPLGAVVAVHGGPTWHIENRFSVLVQYLVRCGFVVLEPNYRGSTGFGPAWRDAIKLDGWGGREQDDIRSGIRMLRDDGIVLAGTIGITGVSYGGYSSWCAITRWPREDVVAAAPVCGMTDLVVDYETTRPDLRSYSEEMMGGSPADRPDLYRERSPIHFVQNIRGHLVIVQGMQDPNVTPENLVTVQEALDKAGIRYEVLTFADEGHGIAKAENRRGLYTWLADFFADAFAENLVAG
ncbi:MAG: prolyl oligopeptidase family serine peptidase [Rhodospirillaceae bacterium]|nr:prolyl oligopeptidase family serine peptidase [Rhodospirillaceae bacterium]